MDKYETRLLKDKIIGYTALLITLILFVIFSWLVVDTVKRVEEIVIEHIKEDINKENEAQHLPSVCRGLYYDEDHNEWYDCMEVGYK